MAERGEAVAIPIDVMQMVDEFVWTLEDTAAFVGGRVAAAVRRYIGVMLPPLAAALMHFSQEYEYSWHTPGHTGGTAFLKSPVGRIFFDYFGENMLRSDLSISVGGAGFAARSHRADRRAREVRRARVRRASHVLRHERHVDVEPRDLHGGRGARPDRAVRPQLSQVDRAQPGDDRRHPALSGAAAQPLRHHRPDSAGAPQQGSDRAGPSVQSAGDARAHRCAQCIRSSRTRRTTGFATTRAASRSCWIRASTASISTKPGTPTRASTRSIATGMPCTATRRITRARRSSPRTRPTSCWPRCRRLRSCTFATGAARSRTRASTSRT